MLFMNLLKIKKEKRKSKGSYTEESNLKQVCDDKGGG